MCCYGNSAGVVFQLRVILRPVSPSGPTADDRIRSAFVATWMVTCNTGFQALNCGKKIRLFDEGDDKAGGGVKNTLARLRPWRREGFETPSAMEKRQAHLERKEKKRAIVSPPSVEGNDFEDGDAKSSRGRAKS